MKTIYLTGFMGSGKTTIGRELARYLQLPVIDTDEEIIKETGISINEIFSTYGESHFRDLEVKILSSLPTQNVVITTGGGIVLKDQNREWMKKHGVLVYLHCDFEVIWTRLQHDQTRPLVKNSRKDELEQLYQSRKSVYHDYNLMIDTSALQLSQIVKQLADMIKNA
ncbi:shikimate kinase [Bacillus mesophilus]|uniref:Shikimate kinase n=1 Tax=Bacillus mesophilus TaxID=1808955 RepID=A0A6M0Q766_9BACI|nr:shikimate kinase [Bacillus mesophilus]MBM7660865.1 shikimate kinase [Bacillus mesophilus]NEY71589.1 shikimate kinase [Bacillus mesophilus]